MVEFSDKDLGIAMLIGIAVYLLVAAYLCDVWIDKQRDKDDS